MFWRSCVRGLIIANREAQMPNPIYMVVGYGIFWALTLILVGSIWARQRRLDREVAGLRALLDEVQK